MTHQYDDAFHCEVGFLEELCGTASAKGGLTTESTARLVRGYRGGGRKGEATEVCLVMCIFIAPPDGSKKYWYDFDWLQFPRMRRLSKQDSGAETTVTAVTTAAGRQRKLSRPPEAAGAATRSDFHTIARSDRKISIMWVNAGGIEVGLLVNRFCCRSVDSFCPILLILGSRVFRTFMSLVY